LCLALPIPKWGSLQQLEINAVNRASLDIRVPMTERSEKLLYLGPLALQEVETPEEVSGGVQLPRISRWVWCCLEWLRSQSSSRLKVFRFVIRIPGREGMEAGQLRLSGKASHQHLGGESEGKEGSDPRERSTYLMSPVMARVSHLTPSRPQQKVIVVKGSPQS